MVIGVQSGASADSWHCTQYGAGQACIHEIPSGHPGGAIIQAEFYNNAGAGNYAGTKLWATDFSPDWFIGSTPTVGDAWVPLNGRQIVGSNFLPLGHGTCHTYQAQVVLRNGNALYSPKVQYCYDD